MSSSYLKRAALLSLLAAPTAWAEQNYFIPLVEVSVERDSNRELLPASQAEKNDAYKATLEARMGRGTPRSQTELRPRAIFQEFADRDGVDPLEYFLDLRHDFRTTKGRFSLTGSYAHQDTINAEFGNAVVDDGDPTTPPPPVGDDDSGIVFVGQTRQTYELTPTFQYVYTERVSLGGTFKYQAVRYGANVVSQRVGYDSPLAELALIYKTGLRTSVSFGPYASRYEADDDGLQGATSFVTDTYGLRLGLDHQWSELSTVSVGVRGERNETSCDCIVPLADDSSTEWGVEVLGVRKNRVGSVRYSIGRFLLPSTLGSRRESDQAQLQFDRPFSEKMGLRTALRLSRDQAIGSNLGDEKRDRVRAELSLTRLLTPQWYLVGGYRFAWQDLGAASDAVDSHAVFLSVGFKGLDRRRGAR